MDERVRFSDSATCSKSPRKQPETGEKKEFRLRSLTRAADQTAATPGTLEFFARSVEVVCTIEDHVLHNGFGCAVMEHCIRREFIRRWCGLAGPMNSSSTAVFQFCARNMASQQRRWSKRVLPLLRKKPAAKSSVLSAPSPRRRVVADMAIVPYRG